MKIKKIKARKILDSRDKPTLEVEINSCIAKVPSGASTGELEAKVIDVDEAIKNIKNVIAPKLIGMDVINQEGIDRLMIEMDGTLLKEKLGGNTLIGVSMALARAGAKSLSIPLWEYISNLSDNKPRIPMGAFNIINGGAHAKNTLDVQEFMIIPQHGKFNDILGSAQIIHSRLEGLLMGRFGKMDIGDEGGFSPNISSTTEALDYLVKSIEQETRIILDCAASQFYKGDAYEIDGNRFDRNQLVDYYSTLINKYPIIGIEDGLEEQDWEGFSLMYKELGDKISIIGDDLLVTDVKRMKLAAEKTACNAAIIKVNQIGTITEAIEAVNWAKGHSWKLVVSHRSGETMDDFIADFSVGVGSDFIKSGAPSKPERMAKYKRLLNIEKYEI
jgi:enolase